MGILHPSGGWANRAAKFFLPPEPPGEMSTTVDKIDWGTLTNIEPRLNALATEAAQIAGSGDWPEWSGIKRKLVVLAGWHAQHPQLRTEQAYRVAYDHLLAIFEGGQ